MMKLRFLFLFLVGSIFLCADSQEVTPKAAPIVRNGIAEPYVTVDLIYWKVREDGLGYIASGIGQGKGKVREPGFDSTLGFKAGLGLNIGHDGWDVYAQYTWFRDDDIDTFDGSNGVALLGVEQDGINSAKEDWDFRMSVIDVEWGRHFHNSPHLTLRPFFGVKWFWSDQDLKLDYVSPSATNRLTIEGDYWGFGLRTGLNSAWLFTRNWSVFGNFAISAEWSRNDVRWRDTLETVHFKDRRFHMIPVIELALGMRYEYWFNQDSIRFAMQVGWEEQMWWDYNRMISLLNRGDSNGNLNFQGLTVRLRFDF